MDDKIKRTIESLKNNGFNVEYFMSSDEAVEKVLGQISENEEVGIGGSITIKKLELDKKLSERGNNVYWHWLVEPAKRNEARAKASVADVYLSSSNAITEDGKLVNIDGTGNRVSSMFYGHKKIFIIAGVNKITADYESAIDRIKSITCPQNAERLGLKTPCRYTGKCSDCKSEDRMCNVTVTIERKPGGSNISIYLINEELGY